MLLDTQHVDIKQKLANIAQSVWKVCEECVKVCEGVCESVWNIQNLGDSVQGPYLQSFRVLASKLTDIVNFLMDGVSKWVSKWVSK